jgi:NTE family protein
MKTDLEEIKSKYGKMKFKDRKGTLAERLEKLENKRFSDTISKDKNGKILQWVHFVQEGGGTLGISLVGYVFVLEYLGIRFLRLAGTSAGAINTLFLASMGEKDEPKSAELFDMMMYDKKRFDMSSFIDAKLGIVRFMIFSLSRGPGLVNNILISYLAVAALALVILPLLSYAGVDMAPAYLIFMALFIGMSAIIVILLWRLHQYRYGINPGKVFENFLKRELKKSGITTQEHLRKKAEGYMEFDSRKFVNTDEGKVISETEQVRLKSFAGRKEYFNNDAMPENEVNHEHKWYSNIISEMDDTPQIQAKLSTEKFNSDRGLKLPKLYLIRDEEKTVEKNVLNEDSDSEGTEDKKLKEKDEKKIGFDYSFVTTDIANQCKIVFPRDEKLYDFGSAVFNPSIFVRASMAIPMFFEPKIIPANKSTDWLEAKGIVRRSTNGILIDGGSLSNFPINLFHISHIQEPRVPVLGARIMDEKPVVNQKQRLTFSSYVGNVINTLRNNEDSSFLAVNPFYRKHSIAEIKAYETKTNWLNFGLSFEEKEILFLKGVEAALSFLEDFDWKQYKLDRERLNQKENMSHE